MDRKHGQSEKWTSLYSIEKCCGKFVGPVKDEITGDRRRRNAVELETLYSGSDVLMVIGRKRLRWDGHGRWNQNPLVRAVIEQSPVDKKPLGTTKNALGRRCKKKRMLTRREVFRIGKI